MTTCVTKLSGIPLVEEPFRNTSQGDKRLFPLTRRPAIFSCLVVCVHGTDHARFGSAVCKELALGTHRGTGATSCHPPVGTALGLIIKLGLSKDS